MIQIVTDSSTLYTVDEAQSRGLEATPLCVNIGDFEGRDLQIDMKAYYQRIAEGQIPRSSQPPVGDVMDVYEKYAGKKIINIAMADGLSGTYQSACGARESVDNKDDIIVFNSKTLCGPHRYMVDQAQQMKEDGASVEEILAWLEKASNSTESFLIPQDFAFLKRGGRLSPGAAALGSALHLKPVMYLRKDGTKLDKFGVKRTMLSAAKVVLSYLKEAGLSSRHILYIAHADAPEDAATFKEMFEKNFEGLEIRILELSPVFVAQGGPKCVAIQYIER